MEVELPKIDLLEPNDSSSKSNSGCSNRSQAYDDIDEILDQQEKDPMLMKAVMAIRSTVKSHSSCDTGQDQKEEEMALNPDDLKNQINNNIE